MAKSILASFCFNTVGGPTGANQNQPLSGCWEAHQNISAANISQAQLRIPANGKLTKFTAVTAGNTRNGTVTFKLSVNGSTVNNHVDITASTPGTYTDSSSSDNVVAGDLVCVNCSAFGGTSGTINMSQFSCVYEPDDGTTRVVYGYIGLGTASITAANAISNGIFGGTHSSALLIDGGTSSTAETKMFCYAEGTYRNLRANITSNNIVGVNPDLELYKNGIATGVKIPITASVTTGVQQDSVNSVSVVKGDYLEYRQNLTGRTSGGIGITNIDIEFQSNGANFDFFGACTPTFSGISTVSGSTYHGAFGNLFPLSTGGATGYQFTMPFECRLDNFWAGWNQGTTTSTTFNIEKNGSAGNGALTNTTNADVTVHDSTHVDHFAAGDLLGITATLHSTLLNWFVNGVTITPTGVGTITDAGPTVSGVGIKANIGVGTTAGSATVSGVGRSLNKQAATTAGSATVSGVGHSLYKGVGTITISGIVVTGDAHNVAGGTGSASGSATVSGVGRSLDKGTGTSAGVATVSGVGRSLFKGVGTTGGSATVSAVGIAAAIRSPSISAHATVSGVGTSGTGHFGLSAGRATVSGVGLAARIGVGTTGGSATVSGVGRELGKGIGTAGGSVTVSGSGARALTLDGHASDTGTNSSNPSPTATLTTSFAGDWVVAIASIYTSAGETSFSTSPSVNITSPNLEWAVRRRYDILSSAGHPFIVYEWAAYAANALSSEAIKMTVRNGATYFATLETFGVANADPLYPWDQTAPTVNMQNTTQSDHNHAVTFSTSDADTFEIAHISTQESGTTKTADSGFTALDQLFSSTFLTSRTEYKRNSALQSSVTQNVWANDTNTKDFVALIDAMRKPQTTWNGPQWVSAGDPTVYGTLGVTETSQAINLPASVTAGNLLVAQISITAASAGSNTPITVVWPAGWTKISEFRDTTIGQTGSWAWRKANGTEGGSTVTATWTHASNAGMCRCDQYSNVDFSGASPIGDFHTAIGNTTAVANTAVTTTKDNSLVVGYLDYAESDVIGPPAGYTGRHNSSHVGPFVYGSWHIFDEPVAISGTMADSPNMTAVVNAAWLQWTFEILAAPPGATASGHATVTGISQAAKLSTGTAGNASGKPTVSGVGRSLAKAIGMAGGSASMHAEGGHTGTASGHATVLGVGIRAKVGKGTSGGKAIIVQAIAPSSIGAFDVLEPTDIMDFEGNQPAVGTADMVETTDFFGAIGSQPLTGTWGSIERTDTMNFRGSVMGSSGRWGSTDRVDTLTMRGYTASVGLFTPHEQADRFSATGAGVTSTGKKRRQFFVS